MRIANKDAYKLASCSSPFEGSNLKGVLITPHLYVIYSYHTPIAFSYRELGAYTTWNINATRYSVSSSKHLSQLRQAFCSSISYAEVEFLELLNLYSKGE